MLVGQNNWRQQSLNNTGNRHGGISIKSLRSCCILYDLEISENPSRPEVFSKHLRYVWLNLYKMSLGILVHFGRSFFESQYILEDRDLE